MAARTLTAIALALALGAASAQACRCNGGLALPRDVRPRAPSLGNAAYDVSALGVSLLASSPGSPHKLAMLFASMYEAQAAAPGARGAQLTSARVATAPSPAAAGLEALKRFLKAEPAKQPLLAARAAALGLPVGGDPAAAALVSAVLRQHPLTDPARAGFVPANPASGGPDADCAGIKAADKWQALCVAPAPGAPCSPQRPPFVPLFNASLVSAGGARGVARLLAGLAAPPAYAGALGALPFTGGGVFAEEHRAALRTSGALGDRGKFVAELFAPGAAGQVARVALQEVLARRLPPEEAVRVLFAATAAARDAAVAAVTVKLVTQSTRPISVLQCAFAGTPYTAWAGPYQGVRTRVNAPGMRWRPYLPTPPFPGYVSGHSAVFAAGAAALRRTLGEDVARGNNCAVRKKGASVIEPRIAEGAPGYVAGLTDVPNAGPGTKGYSPARDVTVCWDGFTAYSELLSYSRELGGIHIPADNRMGVELGRRVGETMVEFALRLFDGQKV